MDGRTDNVAPSDTGLVADLASKTWQRVSPAAIIYYVIKFVGGILRNGLQAVVPVTAIVATAGDNRWFALVTIASIGGALMIVGAVLSYLNFKFRMEERNFLIRSGVLKRKRLTLSFDRIQNVALREPLYFRPLGLVVLTLESAGSSSEEVSLAGIPRSLANSIRQHILEWKSSQQSTAAANDHADAEQNTTATDSAELLRQPMSELVKYGLSNNNIFVFAGIFAVLFSQADKFWETHLVADLLATVGDTIGTSIIAVTALVIFVVLAILSLLVGASVLGAIITNYNYHLTYSDQKYHRSRGLFNREETSVPEVKIQSLRISQPFIAQLLDRFHLTFQQVGFEGKGGTNKKQSFIIPSVQKDFYQTLTARQFPNSSILGLPLKSISSRFVTRHAVYSVGIASIIVATLATFVPAWVALVPLIVPILFLPILILRRHRYGYATDGKHGLVRSGLFGHKQTIFPFYKVQTMEIIQSPGQRKHGLANLKIKLAGRSLTIPYIPLEDAVSWRNTALREIETNDTQWM